MNNVDKQYQELLKKIIETGCEKESGRENMPNTIGISNSNIYMNLSEGFPLLTTKKMYWKGIVHELLWFLRGETNIKYLVDNNVNIWNGDAYRWYLKHREEALSFFVNKHDTGLDYEIPYSMENFIDLIKKGELYQSISVKGTTYALGDLGKVYGYQWRNQNGVDQVADVINGLKTNPYSRYHIIDGWNKADFSDMALPPCHLLYQFICRPLSYDERIDIYFNSVSGDGSPKYYHPHYDGNTSSNGVDLNDNERQFFINLMDEKKVNVPKYALDLNMYQRSCDTFLGVPFNLASMSLLLLLMSKVTNMVPGIGTWIGGDTHLYVNHIPMAEEQLSREPMDLCDIVINKDITTLEDIENLTIDDFEIINYVSHPPIKAELFTGNKK